MALSSPKIDYIGIRDDLLTLLRDNVSDLNVGMTTTITDTTGQIIKGNPNLIPSYASIYPYIIVDFENKAEEYKTLGARKNAVIIFSVYTIYKEISDGAYEDDDQKMVLISNIEGLLRDNVKFTSGILYCRIPETSFNLGDDGTYVSGGVITLELQVEVI